ncbi:MULTISPECIES: hypothetical protein [unclassified Cellulophaga]|uniref:hypothetical protein n=1 Tax=unclassified Cellulophaga TaxID=2634405 RepID=UPI0026E2643C|nr:MULTISPECIES: hypothetical protein [unclassified Cellulophaga]MDO6492566.1 hypothetical protein [Cellulophaga sp. 2_MG-2023]MDO6493668.1 hypothetical protein [Cellulophaga sp. 3_MG-2023]
MKKTVLKILILTLILTSCKQNNKSELKTRELAQIEISDGFKLEFLNQILSDNSKSRLLFDKKELISNLSINVPPTLPIDLKNPKKTISHSEFISDTLRINDTDFVKKQFQKNKDFDISKIKKYGFNIIDIKQYTENEIAWDSINNIAEKYYKKNSLKNIYSILYITKPIFNKKLNLAYVRIRQGSGGMTRIYEKQNEIWKVKYELDEWVE